MFIPLPVFTVTRPAVTVKFTIATSAAPVLIYWGYSYRFYNSNWRSGWYYDRYLYYHWIFFMMLSGFTVSS